MGNRHHKGSDAACMMLGTRGEDLCFGPRHQTNTLHKSQPTRNYCQPSRVSASHPWIRRPGPEGAWSPTRPRHREHSSPAESTSSKAMPRLRPWRPPPGCHPCERPGGWLGGGVGSVGFGQNPLCQEDSNHAGTVHRTLVHTDRK